MAFKRLSNSQDMLNHSLETILKNTRVVFNRHGQDYSLELHNGASNVAFTQTEAKKSGISINTEVRNVRYTDDIV